MKLSGWILRDDRKIIKQEFRLQCLTMRVINHWNRIPREGGASPSLAAFK